MKWLFKIRKKKKSSASCSFSDVYLSDTMQVMFWGHIHKIWKYQILCVSLFTESHVCVSQRDGRIKSGTQCEHSLWGELIRDRSKVWMHELLTSLWLLHGGTGDTRRCLTCQHTVDDAEDGMSGQEKKNKKHLMHVASNILSIFHSCLPL